MAADYELTMDSLREMLERAHTGEKPDTLIGEFFFEQAIEDDDEEFGCCNGGPCFCE